MTNNKIPFNVNIFPADSTGCDFYRNLAPRETIEHCTSNILFNTCKKFMIDDNFFKGTNVNILQRQVNNAQCEYYLKYIIPIGRKYGSWIVYNIDDCIHKDDLPEYNNSWESYQDPQYVSNIEMMLRSSDFVLVTTDELGQYYTDRFNVSKGNIIVIPNYIPQWWMGGFYDIKKRAEQYDKHVVKNHKPRIGLIGSPSHYDMNNKRIKNDITELVPYIRKTTKEYQWVVFGAKIPELADLIDSHEVEYHIGCDVLHYPQVINSLELQYIVAPLVDNIFNRCKSNIKLTESWAMGIGCAGQNLPTYSKYTKDVFGTNDELNDILKHDLKDEASFLSKLESNMLMMNNWWLENHLDKWMQLYKIRQKPLVYNYDGSFKPTLNINNSSNGAKNTVVEGK